MKAGTVAAAALLALAVSPAAAGAVVVTPEVVKPQVVTPQVAAPPAATPAPPAPAAAPAPAQEALADTEAAAAMPTPSAGAPVARPQAPGPSPHQDSPDVSRPRPYRPGVRHYLPGGGSCAGSWSSCAPAYWAAQSQLNFEVMLWNDLSGWLLEPVGNFFDVFIPDSSFNRDTGPDSPFAPENDGGFPSSDEGGQSFSPEEDCQCSIQEEGEGLPGPGGIRRLEEDPKLDK
jgi:hypothetical protein